MEIHQELLNQRGAPLLEVLQYCKILERGWVRGLRNSEAEQEIERKMSKIQIVKREMTAQEFERMKVGFDEHTLDHGVDIQSADRFGFVAEQSGEFIGCSSGLAYKNSAKYSGWFYLTDLFVEKEYRAQGWGAKLLGSLEELIASKGVKNIWTWTAGYEAPKFYQKQGYHIFTVMENWYSDGSGRVGLRKKIIYKTPPKT